jgi:threonine aldolase
MIDLRSDMLGRRSATVLQAITAAAADPPEMDDAADPHKRSLELRGAAVFGLEDALFLPTCTMANQIAIRLSCGPGEVVLAEEQSHLLFREADAATEIHRVRLRTAAGHRGHLSPQAVAAAVKVGRRPRLVWLENTHNMAGGTVMPQAWLAEIVRLCRSDGARLHIDGSRIWNASVASGEQPAALARDVDSLAVSLNKALDAPVGALLLGRADFIREAAALRRALGGFWRPAGMLAAAALAAMQDFVPRIARTHEQAAVLARGLATRLPECAVEDPETNIVMLQLPAAEIEAAVLDALKAQGVAALGFGRGRIRFVVHSGISDEDLNRAITIIDRIVHSLVPHRPAIPAEAIDAS